MRRAAAVMAAIPLLVAGCQSGDEPPLPTPSVTAVATTGVVPSGPETSPISGEPGRTNQPTAPTSPTAVPPGTPTTPQSPAASGPPWSQGEVENAGAEMTEDQEITGVRVGVQDGFDRVVLDLTGEEPGLGWFADFTDDAVEDPSDLPIDMEGDAFLDVSVGIINWTQESPERYDGTTVEGGGAKMITEVHFGGLFEGYQQVVVGLRSKTAYRIFGLSNPARIVIDVQHP